MLIVTSPAQPVLFQNQCITDVDVRFHDINYEISEQVATLQHPSSLCAQQVGVLPAGAVQYYACTQGGVLSIDRSRLFMVGRYVQLRKIKPSQSTSMLHIYEIEVHGY